MARDTVYLKIGRNVLVHTPAVTLKDIAKMTSTDSALVDRLKTLKVHTFHAPRGGSRNRKQEQVFSVLYE